MKLAEKQVGLDMVSVAIGWHEARTGAPGRDLPGVNRVDYVRRVKDAFTTIQVAFGGRQRDPFIGEQFITNELFDFWKVCHPFLADLQLLHKLEEDRPEEIKSCQAVLACLAPHVQQSTLPMYP